MNKTIALIGYSGYAYVVFDIFFSQGLIVSAYASKEAEKEDPFMLSYLGYEQNPEVLEKLKDFNYFVCLPDNTLRQKTSEFLIQHIGNPEFALHKSAIISRSMNAGIGVMIGPRAVVNAKAVIGAGTIINTGSIIEHTCTIGNYTHIGSGSTVGEQVTIGDRTWIGTGCAIAPGISIGKDVVIPAGAVITKNISDHTKIAGTPAL